MSSGLSSSPWDIKAAEPLTGAVEMAPRLVGPVMDFGCDDQLDPCSIAIRLAVGTIAPSPWAVPELYRLAFLWQPALRLDPFHVDPDPIEIAPGLVRFTRRARPEIEQAPASPESAGAAREVRDRTGLSAAELASILDVTRETFQRWTAGAPPSAASLEKLLALRHLLRAVADRVQGDPRTWLRAPAGDSPQAMTPLALLREGRAGAVWALIADRATRAPSERYVAADGRAAVRMSGSLRSADVRTPAEEDEYEEDDE